MTRASEQDRVAAAMNLQVPGAGDSFGSRAEQYTPKGRTRVIVSKVPQSGDDEFERRMAVEKAALDLDDAPLREALHACQAAEAALRAEVGSLEAALATPLEATSQPSRAGTAAKGVSGGTRDAGVLTEELDALRIVLAAAAENSRILLVERRGLRAARMRAEVVNLADRLTEQSAETRRVHTQELAFALEDLGGLSSGGRLHASRQRNQERSISRDQMGSAGSRGAGMMTHMEGSLEEARRSGERGRGVSEPGARLPVVAVGRRGGARKPMRDIPRRWDSAAVPLCISRSKGLAEPFRRRALPPWEPAGLVPLGPHPNNQVAEEDLFRIGSGRRVAQPHRLMTASSSVCLLPVIDVRPGEAAGEQSRRPSATPSASARGLGLASSQSLGMLTAAQGREAAGAGTRATRWQRPRLGAVRSSVTFHGEQQQPGPQQQQHLLYHQVMS